MSAPTELRGEDLIISRFRTRGQKVHEEGRGCMVLHKPTQKNGVGEDPALPFVANRNNALAQLAANLGLPKGSKVDECPQCHQRRYVGLPPNWKVTTLFSYEATDVGEVTVYEDEEEPGNFRWEYVSADGSDSEVDDEEVYLSLNDACVAALAHLNKQPKRKNEEKSDGE